MKKIILSLSLILGLASALSAKANCFLAKKNNKILISEGDCTSRYAPCSTFKIALSLMGYNERILTDENNPQWEFKKGYTDWLEIWRKAHTPSLWTKNSAVWYSQVLTQKLGVAKFKDYVTSFNYGNMDLSGDKGKNNGLTNAWLSSSLELSPEEQLVFLQKLLDNQLPVSLKAHEMTKNIMFSKELPGSWKLYGKTGSGSQLSEDKMQKLDLQIGWFIGWVQKDKHKIIFVNFIKDSDKQPTFASLRAKAAAKERLLQIIKTSN